jgi:hypothetical protein
MAGEAVKDARGGWACTATGPPPKVRVSPAVVVTRAVTGKEPAWP